MSQDFSRLTLSTSFYPHGTGRGSWNQLTVLGVTFLIGQSWSVTECSLFSSVSRRGFWTAVLNLCDPCAPHTQTFPLVSFSSFRLAEGVGHSFLFYRLSHILQMLVCDKSDILICICLTLNGFRICARREGCYMLWTHWILQLWTLTLLSPGLLAWFSNLIYCLQIDNFFYSISSANCPYNHPSISNVEIVVLYLFEIGLVKNYLGEIHWQ